VTRRHVIVSPHRDDAVWSCGGWIDRLTRDGAACLVVTVFDGACDRREGWANDRWRRGARAPGQASEHRRALRRVGAHGVGLGFIDAALRASGDAPAYREPSALFAALPATERALVGRVADAVAGVVERGDRLYLPAAPCGAHADHRIVREAARRIDFADIRLYDEFPYALPPPPGWRARIEPVALAPWIASGQCYRSQVLALFGSAAAFAETLRAHAAMPMARGGYGVRLWRPMAAS